MGKINQFKRLNNLPKWLGGGRIYKEFLDIDILLKIEKLFFKLTNLLSVSFFIVKKGTKIVFSKIN